MTSLNSFSSVTKVTNSFSPLQESSSDSALNSTIHKRRCDASSDANPALIKIRRIFTDATFSSTVTDPCTDQGDMKAAPTQAPGTIAPKEKEDNERTFLASCIYTGAPFSPFSLMPMPAPPTPTNLKLLLDTTIPLIHTDNELPPLRLATSYNESATKGQELFEQSLVAPDTNAPIATPIPRPILDASPTVSCVPDTPPSTATDVTWYETLSELTEQIERIRLLPTFCERIKAFSDLCSQVDSADGTDSRCLWVTIHGTALPSRDVHFKIVMYVGEYFSMGIDESSFPIVPNHHHICVYEFIGDSDVPTINDPILRIRACEQYGELVWISNGTQVSGGEVADFYLLLEQILGINMYLYDDAQVTLPIKLNSKERAETRETVAKIWLKSQAIERVDLKTWYQRALDFEVAEGAWKIIPPPVDTEEEGNEKQACTKKEKESAADLVRVQNPTAFKEALDRISSIQMHQLYAFYKKYSGAAKLVRMFKSVFEKEHITTSTKTLGEMARRINVKALDRTLAQKVRECALRYQYFIHQNLFSPWGAPKDATEIEKRFWDANRILARTIIFKKPACRRQ